MGKIRHVIFINKSPNAWFNFTCYHPPPGQPRGQVKPFGPGDGELFETVLSRGEGAAQIENNFLLFL